MCKEWWRGAVLYQIYPRSFMDGNGDGVGDLQGVRSRLHYIEELGVDGVWFSPIFASPMRDFGYDVSDYRAIDPVFGTMEDFDRLLEDLHKRNLKCLLDFVPNHSSDLHRWFEESRSSVDSPKRDWYVWKDPTPDGGPPNNWLGAHGGGAWGWDSHTEQYYLHSFLPEMPDLNWENPELRQAMYDAMRFWLDRGVDGFRVDVILRLAKDLQFRDEPKNPEYTPDKAAYDSLLHVHTRDVDHVHSYIREMRRVMDDYPGRVLIGETYLPVDRLMNYYGKGDEVHIPFNFGLITKTPKAKVIRDYIRAYSEALPKEACPNWVLGNHDNGRIADPERAGEERAAAFGMLLLTLPGAICCYFGDEIGMLNGIFQEDEVLDRSAINTGGKMASRDRARTPMQWSSSPYGGFSEVKPWLPVAREHHRINVEAQESDPKSLLSLYKRLIQFRHDRIATFQGSMELLDTPDRVLAYKVGSGDNQLTILIDLDGGEGKLRIRDCLGEEMKGTMNRRILLSSDPDLEGKALPEELPPSGGVIF